MIQRAIRIGGSALVMSAALAGTALAGGYNRGSANLDGLYSDKIGAYAGITYVAPGRSYSSVSGLTVVGGAPRPLAQGSVEFGESYAVPYASVGGQLIDNVACVASYAQPYGADSSYTGAITYHIAQQSLASDELGLTCSYRMDAGKGRFSFIGGVFNESIEYKQARNFTTAFGVVGDSRIRVTSDAWGFRVGAAFEIPEIAFKAQLMYRSQTNHNATGNYFNTPFRTLAAASGAPAALLAAYGTNMNATASTSASLPQNIELAVQSGIAPGWLAFGSVKWTDWSVLEQISLVEGIARQPFSTSRFFFKDGWTVTAGIGHKFTDNISGSASITWDRGVSTGWDTLTDVWSFAGGAAIDLNENFQLRAGGALLHLASGQKTKTSGPVDYTAVSPSEWGYALSASASLKF